MGVLGRMTTRCAKPRCAEFLGEKDGYVNVEGYGLNPPPIPSLKYINIWTQQLIFGHNYTVLG